MKDILMGNVKSKTSWVGTLIAVFGVLYDNWSQVATLIPPQHVGKAFSILGVIVLVLRNISSGSIADKTADSGEASKQGGFARPGFLVGLFAVATVILGLTSCATFQNNQGTFRLAIDVAIIKLIDNSSAERREPRRANIIRVAGAVKTLAAADGDVTLEALRAAVGAQIDKLNLSPVDRAIAIDIAEAIAQEIQRRVGQGLLKPDQRVAVSQVMDWVIAAAESVPRAPGA